MKLLLLDRRPEMPVKMPPVLTLVPDSALVVGGTPLFLGDYAAHWMAKVFLAFRIMRLGKNISPKFASRYFDAVTLGVRAVAVELEEEMLRSGEPSGLCGALDSCVALGRWVPLSSDGAYDIDLCGLLWHIDATHIDIAGAVSSVSRYMTLKTGDVIGSVELPETLPLVRDMKIEGSLGEEKVLRIKIK